MSQIVNKPCNLEKAIELARKIEPVVSALGWHVGITGGCLYNDGDRKDADIILYPHNCRKLHKQKEHTDKVLDALEVIGLKVLFDTSASEYGNDKCVWVTLFEGYRVDLFFLTSI